MSWPAAARGGDGNGVCGVGRVTRATGVEGTVLEAGTDRMDGDRDAGGGGRCGDGRLVATAIAPCASVPTWAAAATADTDSIGEDEGEDRREGASAAPA